MRVKGIGRDCYPVSAGFAFLGALKELQDTYKILSFKDGRLAGQIRGVGGSSAGAITALMLSCGFSPTEIEYELQRTDFSQFWDKPSPGKRPGLYRSRYSQGPRESTFVDLFKNSDSALVHAVQRMADLEPLFDNLLKTIGLDPPFNRLLRNIQAVKSSLIADLGIFHGERFHDYFARVIGRGLARLETGDDPERKDILSKGPTYVPQYFFTFKQHQEQFQCHLGIMASNLRTQQSVLFSALTTPNFPVAAAVRISMSLPIAFKPIILREREERGELLTAASRNPEPPKLGFRDLEGTWIDGGLFNNIPLDVLDEVWASSSSRRRKAGGKPEEVQDIDASHRTLGLRLAGAEMGKDPKPVDNLLRFLWVWLFELGVFGSGEAHISKSLLTQHRTVLLPTDSLSLFDFKPPSGDEAQQIETKARDAIREYFKQARPEDELSEGNSLGNVSNR